jgi:hypothetical protein
VANRPAILIDVPTGLANTKGLVLKLEESLTKSLI